MTSSIMPAFLMTRVVFVHQNKSRMEENIMSYPNLIIYKQLLRFIMTAAVAQWLERSPREREVVGSIPDRVIPKTL